MVIGFCGRMRSGKSTLAKVSEYFGYKRLSFAGPLKTLCADILDTTVDELNRIKDNDVCISLPLNEDIQDILSLETDIPISDVHAVCDGKMMNTARELLQFVGTELIREYCPSWHVKKTKEMIDKNSNYVIDDVRFPNEKEMIESVGGDCWFVTRPIIDNLSSHPSETSIRWQDCGNKVIINSESLAILEFKWGCFIEHYAENVRVREETLESILKEGTMNNGKRELADLLFISQYMLSYKQPMFNDNISGAELSPNGVLRIQTGDEQLTSFITQNPLEIEDIKFII